VFIVLVIQYSCNKKNEKPEVDSEIEINSFEFIDDFKLNKSLFTDTKYKADSYSNYDGNLTVYHSKMKNYIVLDFVLLGSDHNLYLTYWTDKDFKIKFSKCTMQSLNLDNSFQKSNQTYSEITNENTSYLSYIDSSAKLYNSEENEILDGSIINRQKQQTKDFFYDLIEPNYLNIHTIVNAASKTEQ